MEDDFLEELLNHRAGGKCDLYYTTSALQNLASYCDGEMTYNGGECVHITGVSGEYKLEAVLTDI